MPSKVYNGLRKSFKKNEFMISTNYHICIKYCCLTSYNFLTLTPTYLIQKHQTGAGRGGGRFISNIISTTNLPLIQTDFYFFYNGNNISLKERFTYVKQIASGNLLCVSGNLNQGRYINLERWDGEGDGKEVQKGGHVCIPMVDSC